VTHHRAIRVRKFNTDGTEVQNELWQTDPVGNAGGSAVDGKGRVYICDVESHEMKRYSADGTFEAAWGTGFSFEEHAYEMAPMLAGQRPNVVIYHNIAATPICLQAPALQCSWLPKRMTLTNVNPRWVSSG